MAEGSLVQWVILLLCLTLEKLEYIQRDNEWEIGNQVKKEPSESSKVDGFTAGDFKEPNYLICLDISDDELLKATQEAEENQYVACSNVLSTFVLYHFK